MRRCTPEPVGMVRERASATPSLERATTLWPMLMPGPKLVYVMPLGAMASIRVRMTESVPGSQPAEMMETASCLIAWAPRERRRATMSP